MGGGGERGYERSVEVRGFVKRAGGGTGGGRSGETGARVVQELGDAGEWI